MSNQRPKLTLDFEIADIPWLLHAMQIQRTTAALYGREGRKTGARIEQYMARIREWFPVLAHDDLEEYRFFNALIALNTAKVWRVDQTKPTWSGQTFCDPVALICDGKVYEITRSCIHYNPELVQALQELCRQIAPLNAVEENL